MSYKDMYKNVEPKAPTGIPFTYLFNGLVKNGNIRQLGEYDPHIQGREEELLTMKETFYKKRMNNVVVIGEAGTGKTALVNELAYQMKDTRLFFELSCLDIIAGTNYRGEFEKTVENILSTFIEFNQKSKDYKATLFIDEIHMIMGLGSTEGAENNCLSNFLKTYLTRDDFSLIGATTAKEYSESMAKDTALTRRVQPVYLNELSKDVVFGIIHDFAEGQVKDTMLKYIVEESKKIPESHNPDISIEITDRVMAHQKMTNKTMTKTDVSMLIERMVHSANMMTRKEED